MGNTCCTTQRAHHEWWDEHSPPGSLHLPRLHKRLETARNRLVDITLREEKRPNRAVHSVVPRSFWRSFEYALLRCTVSFRRLEWSLRGQYFEEYHHIEVNETLRGLSLLVTLFHEYVHAAGGTELDAEVLEQLMFGEGAATYPTPSDFDDFAQEGGRWFSWNKSTGVVRSLDTGEEVIRWLAV